MKIRQAAEWIVSQYKWNFQIFISLERDILLLLIDIHSVI